MRKILRQFLILESASGIILFFAALVAMMLANSPFRELHQLFAQTFLFSINEGLMALFFLLVGLELKRGFMDGSLSKPAQIALPGFAALGGMVVPALIYLAINHDNAEALRGWSTPVATDIAFALGVLSLFGRKVPTGLKLFLLALAIFDDIGAILIIAIFYSQQISYFFLALSFILVLVLYLLNVLFVRSMLPYLLLGACLWAALLYSGIHPTIGGVLLAFAIPSDGVKVVSPAQKLEKILHPYVAYCIMPLFALANVGFDLSEISLQILQEKIVLGIVFGLFIGKQVGVFGFSWLLITLKRAKLPKNTSWLAFYGVTLLCGIGFTMSLFLGTLSFQSVGALYLSEVRIGVIIGSILSGLVGALILTRAFSRQQKRSMEG